MGGAIGTVAPPWWDPNNEGLAVIGAYRAINSVGTPWASGPADYASSKINQANPGTYDLVEGNGALPWAAATGWTFVAAAAQYFNTGYTPAAWTDSFLSQFSNVTNDVLIWGFTDGAGFYWGCAPRTFHSVRYYHGGPLIIAPWAATTNLGVSDRTAYRSGVAEIGVIGGGGNRFQVYIGGTNNQNLAMINPAAFRGHAFVMYSTALTAPQMLAVATAMAQL